VGKLSELPSEDLPEIVFAGRSNVGKSSAINALTNRKRLAFTSKTPGRTQTINFYESSGGARLVDLPGYGYARVPQALRSHWAQLVGGYLERRSTLAGFVVVMDARHPWTPADARLVEWLAPQLKKRSFRFAVLVLLAKCDKLTRNARMQALQEVTRRVAEAGLPVEVRLFSSRSGEGVVESRQLLDQWLRRSGPAGALEP
jgi:GTP-binding protein